MMRKMKLTGFTMVVLSLFVTMIATGAFAVNTIRIGFIVPLTTANALIGWGMQHGAALAVKEINEAGGIKGVNIELLSEDNADTNAIAVNK